MNTHDTFDNLIKDNFTACFKSVINQNLCIATRAFQQHMHSNKEFFSYPGVDGFRGYLLTFAINKQFGYSSLDNNLFAVTHKKVNKFNYNAMFIDTNDFTLNISRTKEPDQLPYPSKYKKELAIYNGVFDNQLVLPCVEDDVKQILEHKKYATIIYGYNYLSGCISHLSLVIPSYDFKTIEYSENLLKDISVYETYAPNLQETIEERIIVLKEDLGKESKQKLGG